VGFLPDADPRLLKKRSDGTRAFGPRGQLEKVPRTTSRSGAPGIVPLVPDRDAKPVAQSKFFEAPHLPVKRLSLLGNKALSSLKQKLQSAVSGATPEEYPESPATIDKPNSLE